MNQSPEQDQDIQEALRMSLVNEEPSENLLRELRVLASNVKPARRSLWMPSLAITGAVAAIAGIVTLTAMTLTPKKASAKTFDMLVAAAGQQNTFQFAVNSEENGKTNHFTIVSVDGKFSMRTDEGALMLFDKGSMRIYDPKENTITQIKLGGIVDPTTIGQAVQSGIADGMKQMDLRKTLREYQEKYGKDHIKISPVAEENGKDVYHVTMDNPKESGRVRMLVDANTDLPERIEVEDAGPDGGLKHNATIQMQFGAQVDPKLLMPDFPKNAKTVDIDLGALLSGAMKGLGGGSEDMKGMGESLKGLGKDIGPMIEKSLKGLKDNKPNFNFGSEKRD